MDGLMWTFAVWALLFVLSSRWRSQSRVIADWFSRENFALALALLGTYSIAATADAADVLRQPLAIERILRGAVAVTGLVLVAPLLVRRLSGYAPGYRALTGLLAYLAVALVSTIYSAAPLVTAAKVVELTAGVAPVLAVALGPDAARRLRSTVLLVLALAGSLVLTAVVGFVVLPSVFSSFQSRPGFLIRETLISPFAHSNTVSAHGATIAVFALASYLSRSLPRRLCLVAGIGGLAGMVLSSGRQGVAMVLAGSAIVLWAQRRALFLTILGPGLAALAFVYRDTLYDALSRNRPDNFTSFTGRLFWWEAAVEAWAAHPWTGWGYAAGGRFVALASVGRARVSSVHSGYIEALVGVGILGLLGLAYALGSVVHWSWRFLRRETGLATLIIPLALRTGVSQGFGGWLNIEFVLFALLAAIADRTRIDRRIAFSRRPNLVLADAT